MRSSNLYIISGPSGSGKTSLVANVVKKLNQVAVSISHTTRKQRPQEINGQHYHFINPYQFKTMIADNQFLEYAKIHQHFYGTAKTWIDNMLKKGIDIILEIDWQGATQVRQNYQAISIFILPPSYEILEKRLRKRSQNNEQEIEQRIEHAKKEILHCDKFDYLMINDSFQEATEELIHIITAAKKNHNLNNTKLKKLLNKLQQQND